LGLANFCLVVVFGPGIYVVGMNEALWADAVSKRQYGAPSSAKYLAAYRCSAEEIPSIPFDLVHIKSYRNLPGQETAAAEYIYEIFCRDAVRLISRTAVTGERTAGSPIIDVQPLR
jgi:hypothetical protein